MVRGWLFAAATDIESRRDGAGERGRRRRPLRRRGTDYK
jgi:hypothetical protein